MPLPMHTARGPKHVIAIAAGKGGVGKSTVTVNLARALQAQGRTVGILDADIYGPSLRRMLPETRLPGSQGERLSPADAGGIRLMTFAYFRKENEAAAVRAPIANSLIQQFLDQVDWGSLDDLLIDFPPGTGDIQLTLCQKAKLTGAIMVTTPQEVALMDVRKAMHLFSQVQVPILGIVENMSYFLDMETGKAHHLFGQGGGERLANETGVRFLGQIPLAPSISQSGDDGTSLFGNPAKDAQVASKAWVALAQNVLNALRAPADTPTDQVAIDQMHYQGQRQLQILWTDGARTSVPIATLQQNCPCAACVDESTGKRRPQAEQRSADEVMAHSIDPVGRYAVKVKFSSGCSTGIYLLSLIRELSAPQ